MFQTKLNLTDLPKREYNGWADWTTWNCALWIGGDEGLYNIAKDCEDYPEVFTIHSRRFLRMMQHLMEQTGGGRLR